MSDEKKELPPALAESLEHSKTQYKQLGKSGLRVSVPILGAMSFGDKKWMPWVVEEEEGLEILKGAWDRGLNTV
jgi:aryl-alcohol dehydrogenase-like predicted oxidoreductase